MHISHALASLQWPWWKQTETKGTIYNNKQFLDAHINKCVRDIFRKFFLPRTQMMGNSAARILPILRSFLSTCWIIKKSLYIYLHANKIDHFRIFKKNESIRNNGRSGRFVCYSFQLVIGHIYSYYITSLHPYITHYIITISISTKVNNDWYNLSFKRQIG